ncbi:MULTISPECIES: GNAT family N-acetyltransferase [unclassified Mesobacillus]|uniref:GNAT family N-acetyltransferase n=1 Tax=unclassified Mesobacillus TaxID=2675270 RepID=UPI00203FDF5D|nr:MULTISPECIES: GNAT family N-acetyltransferase [unclassified Mesobacillus]MCM3125257.1 GNAT family N-acetyltransferase [Mesobacillus sp. MER 33]MCM3235312.1 GNAT family N-acetyltransferase [Mesobacillus sp. MER 48]
MKVEIKRLSDCPLKDGVEAYNRGFEGYFYDQSKTIETFANRFGLDGISPEHSVIAYYEGRPAGIVLSGIKKINGEVIAWNGGTGIAKELRGKGIGKQLMNAALDIYRENQVKYATLEAISRNEGAIQLYQSLGFTLVKKLKFLQYNEPFPEGTFDSATNYQVEHVAPQELSQVNFYRHKTSWQNHKDNVQGGNAMILRDEQNEIAGYSLFKKFYKEGEVANIGLLQLEVAEAREDRADVMKTLLKHSFSPLDRSFKKTTVNTPEEDAELLELLTAIGFKQWEEQVWMIKEVHNS